MAIPQPIEQQARKDDKEDRERAELFTLLVKHPGWLKYVELLNLIIEEEGAALLEPMRKLDDVIRLVDQKGSMYGLIRARDLPHVTIAAMKAVSAASDDGDNDDA